MKKLNWNNVLLIVVTCSVIALYIIHFKKDQKLVYVDSNKLVNGYQGMMLARRGYQSKVTVWKANIDTLAKDVQSEISKYQRESQKMTAKEKELSKKLIQTKQQQLVDYQKATNDKASQEDGAAT